MKLIIKTNGISEDIPQGSVWSGSSPVKYASLEKCVEFVRDQGGEAVFDYKSFIDRLYDTRNMGLFSSRIKGEIPFPFRNEIIKTLEALVQVGGLSPVQEKEFRKQILG